jgi:hypothetical protein
MTPRIRETTSALGLLAAALGLLLASPAAASPRASAHTEIVPPSGIPNLSTMALGVADLAPGAKVGRQGYVKPDEGVAAAYIREFRVGTARLGAKRFMYLDSYIDLAPTVSDAKLLFAFIPLGLALLDPDEIAADFADSGIKPTYVRIGRPARARAGEQAIAMTIKIGTRGGEIRLILTALRVDRVLGYLTIVGMPRVKLAAADGVVLARIVGRHIADGLLPVNTAPPAVSGLAQVGQSLAATTGTWSNRPTAYSYAWRRCDAAGASCTAIAGATAQSYTLTSADAGLTIQVAVTARNGRGSATATSAPSSQVAPAPGSPTNTAPPTISGAPGNGQTLSATSGTWTGDPTSFAYVWRRCDAAGASCTDVAGATNSGYVLVSADAGFTIRVAVTATNAVGSATAVSAQTAVVT